ncbi:phage portal protein [Corynebacterium propinquum]|uniref:phage portal protein n=1 Tax=Corynebacterium propinquum TaxID=43769 RepID=UPI00254297FC|nr:phage portal protein [Corynebacterium propinquum]MDK4252611.1 phage portal protein [Corynebacterium propinquum]WKS49452.1 phage portal protein [Corynebacterium propinquum]
MGLIERLKKATATADNTVASPFTIGDSHLGALIPPDTTTTITRAVAMQVPAVMRARNLIVSTIARCKLIATDGYDEPYWLANRVIDHSYIKSTRMSRMIGTVDDLLFYGKSCWALDRGSDGVPMIAVHVPHHLWDTKDDGSLIVNGSLVSPDEVCIFTGIHDGVLAHGAPAIRDARQIQAAAARVADNPAALIELRQTNNAQLSREEVQQLIDGYVAARKGRNSGVSYSSPGVEVNEHSIAKENLLIDGRNAAAVDVARVMNIPASFIDSSVGGTSLSYQNAATRMTELVAFGLSPMMAAIESRVNEPDMSHGHMKFDVTEIFDSLPLPATETKEPINAPTI